MRIALIGQATFGAKVLEELINRGEEVVGVYCPPDKADRLDPLKELAQQKGIPLFQPPRMRDPEVYPTFASLNPDLGVMAFVTDIIPESILNCPKLGTIQYHPSLLPKHRGGSAINWAIIQGETKGGLTIFWPDKGIDSGPILLQKGVEIDPDDTVGSLYFNKLFPLGVEALTEAIELIKRDEAPRIPQDESQATYEGLCRGDVARISWQRPASQVYNLIRGTNPQPGAFTFFKGASLKIFDCEFRRRATKALPGEIVGIEEQGFEVAAQRGSILVKRVQPQDSPKLSAREFIQQIGLKVGYRFGE